MTDVILLSFLTKVSGALIAFLMIWGLLRVLDKVTGVNFKDRLEKLDDMSFAVYTGARLIAFCLLVGMIMS